MNPIKHVAIIMDGNGRWGLKKKNSRNYGHRAGLLTVEKIIKETLRKKIKYLTLYAFSTENWKRPKKEIIFLFNLLEQYLTTKTKELDNKGIKFKTIGNNNSLPKKLCKILKNSEKITKKNKKLTLNLALNYGSKIELVDTVNLLKKKKISITTSNISKNLYTKNSPDPDILIRTGNTKRLSNFLLWQAAYAEIYFEKKLWPDFNINDYNKVLNNFSNIKRNFGNI